MPEPTATRPTPTGPVLFARYAFGPNRLGLCGPEDWRSLLELGAADGATTAQAVEIDRGLRAEYRKNFRTQYRTFAEFKRAYYGQEQAPAPPRNTLADALVLLGLPKDCTKQQLEAQFKALMKKLHPDVGGTDGLAAKLNEAKDTIMKEKAWAK